MSGPSCARCTAPLQRERRGGGLLRLGRTEVAVPPRDLATCPAGHVGQDAEAVLRAVGLIRLARRSLRRDRCRACRGRLVLPERRGRRAVTVEPDAAPPYTLDFTLPLRRCPDCGVDNVPTRDRGDVRRVAGRIPQVGEQD